MFSEENLIKSNQFHFSERQLSFTGFKGRKPFLKWAGGKSQLIADLLSLIPNSFEKYIEPFIGGGALFFATNHFQSVISDLNEDLIITYRAVRDDVHSVIELLNRYENVEEFYYKIRALDTSALTHIERAARLIYLNKTCFNGLYRVNKKGEFNVPYNKRTGASFYTEESLIMASLAIEGRENILFRFINSQTRIIYG